MGVRGSLERQLSRARNVEGFVRRIVGGGIALVVGLWVGALTDPLSGPWLVGTALALVGLVALGSGIGSEIES